jgi:hypothetical protein
MFCKEVKETTFTYSKQVSFLDILIPKTTLVLCTISYTIIEKTLEQPWCF